MARQRDYQAEQQRRNELARQRGFRSRSEQRRFDRHIKNRRELDALPAAARDQRDLALRAVSLLRNDPGLSLDVAAARLGTTTDAVEWWASKAFVKKDGVLQVRPGDRMFRAMRVLSGGQIIDSDVRGSRKASKVSAHYDAVNQYLATGDDSALQDFEGQTVAGAEFETDIDVLDEMARRGSLDIETIYQVTG
jgi:hypothetical protein